MSKDVGYVGGNLPSQMPGRRGEVPCQGGRRDQQQQHRPPQPGQWHAGESCAGSLAQHQPRVQVGLCPVEWR